MEKSEKRRIDDSDVERNDDTEPSYDENSDSSCCEIFNLEDTTCEAEHEEGLTMRVILPDGTDVYKRVYPSESAFEFKEKCLGTNYPQLQDFTVVLCNDDYEKNTEKTLADEATFTDLLDEYEFIRIRYNESEDSTNKALNPVVKMKPQDGASPCLN